MPGDAHASDEQLAEAIRAGDGGAYAELWRRHAHAGLTAARQFRSIADPEDIVSEAYLKILHALQGGGGPHEAFRPYLYRTIRNVALSWARKGTPDAAELSEDIESTTAPTEDSLLEKTITVRAFRTLPERWQTILWYTEVEGMDPSEAGPFLGLTANAAAALAHRARDGLKKAWLQAHVNDLRVPAECRWTTDRMSDYVRGALSPRARKRFDDHLDTCTRCSILLEEVDHLGGKLATILLPLMLGGGAGAALLAELRAPTSQSALEPRIPRPRVSRLVAATAAVAATLSIASAFALPAILDPSSPQETSEAGPSSVDAPSSTPKASPDDGATASPSPQKPPTRPPAAPPVVSVPDAPPDPPAPPADVTPPAAPAVLAPADGILTNAASPVFTGTGEPGARIEVLFATGQFATTVAPDGTWQAQPAAALPDGVYSFELSQVDAAGNRSGQVTRAVTIDTIALPPTFTAPASPLVYLPLVQGSSEPGATVTVSIDGSPVGSTVADGTGAWTLQLPDPGRDGAVVTATQTDPAGNASEPSTPSAPLVFERPDILSPTEGEVIPSTGGATIISLTLDGIAGMQVEVLVDGVPTGNLHTLQAAPIVRVTVPLPDGQHTIAVRYRDPGTGELGSLLTRTVSIAP